MKDKKVSLIITTIAIMIIDTIIFIFNNLGQNVSSIGNLIFYVKIILAILSILLIRKNFRDLNIL